MGEVLHSLARQKESRILEGHLQPDHVHVLMAIPPKYSVVQIVGCMKRKSAIHIARNYLGQKKNYTGMHFWARGYYVSTVGADEERVRMYIRHQMVRFNKRDSISSLIFPGEKWASSHCPSPRRN